jgi:hypothetical protein
MVPHILNLSSGSALRPSRFNTGKNPGYPLHRKLGNPRAGVVEVVKRKYPNKTQYLPGIEPWSSSTLSSGGMKTIRENSTFYKNIIHNFIIGRG